MKKTTHEEYVKQLSEINPDIEVVGRYEKSDIPLRFRCKTCGYEWEVKAYNLLRGTGCPKCNITNRTKTREQFVREVRVISPSIEVNGEYVNTHTPIACRCGVCGYEWNPCPSVLLKGHGCPKCAGNAPKRGMTVKCNGWLNTSNRD